MHLFYAPDINLPEYTLSEQDSAHAVRVLRLGNGDQLCLTDGKGNMYSAEIIAADPKRCRVKITATQENYGKRSYTLVMAVSPTKNMDRYEWFLEKATEVGCDTFIPVETSHSERRVIKHERAEKVITSAVKQSLKAYHPSLEPLTSVREVIKRPFNGVRLIAHCIDGMHRQKFSDAVKKGDNVLILIGPEGDFSPEEVTFAEDNGFTSVTLGDSRLRTETAGIAAAMWVSFINQ